MNAEVVDASDYLLHIILDDLQEKIDEHERPKLHIVTQDDAEEPPFYRS